MASLTGLHLCRALARNLALLLCFCAASSGASAQSSGCRQWLVPASMEIIQNGQGGQHVYLQLTQEGSNFHGWAQYQTTKRNVIGNLSGTMSGDVFHTRILWTYSGQSSIGQYTGKVKAREGGLVNGKMLGYIFEGSTYDEYVNPPQIQYWNAYHFVCAPEPQAAAEPAKPTLALGRVGVRDSSPPPPICDAARSAKARNSPAAPGLERQCLASGGSMALPLTEATARISPERLRPEVGAAPVPEAPPPDPGTAPSTSVSTEQLQSLASTGSAIANADPAVADARSSNADADFQFGFDVGSALFGDQASGGSGNTSIGAGAMAIRDALGSAAQAGFDASMNFHFSRH